jgi:diphosphomevalonate decarboxylase
MKITYRAPANIAIVKYWGKLPSQIPMNPSLSMTLDSCQSITTALVSSRTGGSPLVQSFTFNGQENPSFGAKVEKYLSHLATQLPSILTYQFQFEAKNTFPHSAGIASSASGFAAIAGILGELLLKDLVSPDLERKISSLARLGSGSACRSIYGGWVSWGSESNEWASPVISNLVLRDAIAIVSSSEKPISSSRGHQLMQEHPFKDVRLTQAAQNFQLAQKFVTSGDFSSLGKVMEDEALMLHALMMTSNPNYILLHPNSLMIIEKVRNFRARENAQIYFTIDAGPNIHLLYDLKDAHVIDPWVLQEIAPLCENARVIFDQTGRQGIIADE